MPIRSLSKAVKLATGSRQRLLFLTIILVILLVASTGALVAHQIVSDLSDVPQTKYQDIPALSQQGQLIVGLDTDQPPFSYKQGEQLVGYNVDLARSLGLEIGLPVTFTILKAHDLDQQSDPSSLLNQSAIHLLITNTAVTSSRQQNFNLSRPYLSVSQVGVSLKGQPFLNQPEQLQDKVIAVLEQTIAQEYALSKTNTNKVVPVKTVDQLVSAIINNQADLFLIDLPTANKLIKDNPQLQIDTNSLIQEPYTIVMAKQQWQLTNLINNSLVTLDQKGVMQSLQQKWLR